MSKTPTVKQMLFNLLTHHERLQFEHWALQSILINCPDAYTRRTWKADLERLWNDAQLRKSAHEKFVPLYTKIDEVNDEAAVIELLSKIPLTGKVN